MFSEPLISQQEIEQAIVTMAQAIDADYAGENLLLVGVLKGSLYFLADLSRALKTPVEIDFVQVSTYGQQQTSSGVFKLVKDLDINIEGRHVLIVEDIVDSGLTLSRLVELFQTRRPKSLRIATLLNKPKARKIDVQIDYVGFEIPNQFVVGYGLDDSERFRNLPHIATFSKPE